MKLDELPQTVEVKGDKARLLAVSERSAFLFGRNEGLPAAKKAEKKRQISLFAEVDDATEKHGGGELPPLSGGSTVLDRVHQSMLLFASGRGEALKRFLVEEGVGGQAPF